MYIARHIEKTIEKSFAAFPPAADPNRTIKKKAA